MTKLHVAEASPEECTRLCRFSAVFWNERRCFVEVTCC
jgi:hypothetical protein